jgi:hypothetical protein
MEDDPRKPTDDPRKGRFLHVSGVQFVGSLGVSLLIFFFASGPLWRHAANIGRLDHAIYWSYAAIPFLIAACLGASKRFTVRGFLLDTLALGVTKYVVTASISARDLDVAARGAQRARRRRARRATHAHRS